MRILVVGAGVIGSVYAGKLLEAGHEVVLLARGRPLEDLQTSGLILHDAESGQRTVLPVRAVPSVDPGDRFDLVLVAVRAEQLRAALPMLAGLRDGSDVLFFGNIASHQARLVDALANRALFGFPAAGGVRDGPVIRYVLIRRQQTMLGEPDGEITDRVRRLRTVLAGAGFPTTITANMENWLLGHAAFVVPIAFALYRVDTDAARLAADRTSVRLMVRATRQAFHALQAAGEAEIPKNLRVLYLRLPAEFAIRYWQRVLRSARGELWFAGHTRAAPLEMRQLAEQLQAAVGHSGLPTPALTELLRPVHAR